MKKITITLSLIFTGIISTSAQNILDFSQDPLSLFMLEHIHPNLYTQADSIVSSLDSGAQFTPQDYMLADYLPNGHIDTATFYDDNGIAEFAYQGFNIGSQTDIIGYDITLGTTLEDRTVFYNDASINKDTLLEYYEFDGSNFQLFTYFRLSYNAQSKMDKAEIHVYDGSSSFFLLGIFEFHYNSGGSALDSVNFVSGIGVPVDLLRLHYFYKGNGEISRIDIKQDTALTGVYQTIAYEIPKYAAGKIYELQQIAYNDTTSVFEIASVTRFLSRTSGIGLKENTDRHISVYPNPAQNDLKVNGLEQNTTYTIINITGAEVKRGTIAKGEPIAISNLIPGTYILQLDIAEKSVSKRFEKL